MKRLIEKLDHLIAPPGYETEVRELVIKEIKDNVDEMRVDALGNLIARRGSDGQGGSRVMLSAHMDEIGLIATHVDENGFVRFMNIGAVRSYYSIGARVRFTSGVQGVIGRERVEYTHQLPPLEKLYIDVGASSRETCAVKVGDVAGFEQTFLPLGDRFVGKSMDNRAGVAVLIEALRIMGSSPNEVFFVFTVQEEVGERGAITSAYGIDPDIGIAVDVTATGDTPNGVKMEVGLGKGPAIKVRDTGMMSDPRLVRFISKTADENGLPYQLEVLVGGTTDARSIQVSRAGVPASCISIPCRNIHSPSQMVDYNDIQNTLKLISLLLKKPIEL